MEIKNRISVEMVADSIDKRDNRIPSMLLTMPRIILAEFNTHRMLSRNSASSRAIPFDKMAKMVNEEPFVPIKWMKEHSGMQGTEYWTDEMFGDTNPMKVTDVLTNIWLQQKNEALIQASLMSKIGASKQICNRLLEPFMYHRVLVTGTEWPNFFAQRAEENAEIHMQDLAYKMLDAMNNSIPKELKPGEWHIPFGDDIDERIIKDTVGNVWGNNIPTKEEIVMAKVRIATARCARTSYTTIDTQTKHDYNADIKLHNRLVDSHHFSPFEHCAICMTDDEYDTHINGQVVTYDSATAYLITDDSPNVLGWNKNFRGFIQYRSYFENENVVKDSRLL